MFFFYSEVCSVKQLITKTHFTPIIHEKSVSRFLRAFSRGNERKEKTKKAVLLGIQPLTLRFRARYKTKQLHHITKFYFTPVEPKPPSPRSELGNSFTEVRTGVI